MDAITFSEAKLEGGWLMIKVPRELLGMAMGWIRRKKNKPYDLIIKEHRKKRSLDANAKAWALIGELSAILKLPPDDIYQGYIPDVGGNYKIIPVKPEDINEWAHDWCKGHTGRMVEDMGPCRSKALEGYHNLKMYLGSSDYDTAQMSRLLDLIIQDCRQVGIETLSDREKSLLLEEWGSAQGH